MAAILTRTIVRSCGTTRFAPTRPHAHEAIVLVFATRQYHHNWNPVSQTPLYPVKEPPPRPEPRPEPRTYEDRMNDIYDSLLYDQKHGSSYWRRYERTAIMRNWIEAGPPPISQYKLTFGKHKGKQLDEVPDTYMAKYLVPRKRDASGSCPLVEEAIEDFMRKHPELQSQAGPGKTKAIEEGIMKKDRPVKRRWRRKVDVGDANGKKSKHTSSTAISFGLPPCEHWTIIRSECLGRGAL